MRIHATALVVAIASAASPNLCQAFSPTPIVRSRLLGLGGKSSIPSQEQRKTRSYGASAPVAPFRKRRGDPLFAEGATASVVAAVAVPLATAPFTSTPVPAAAAAPLATAAGASPAVDTAEIQQLRTELKEAEALGEKMKQEMEVMENKVEKMETQVQKITTEVAVDKLDAISAAAAEDKEKMRLKAEEDARKEKMRLKAEEDAKKEKMRLKAEEDAKKEKMRLKAEEDAKKEKLRLKVEEDARKEKLRKEVEAANTKLEEEKARLKKAEAEKRELVREMYGATSKPSSGGPSSVMTEEAGELPKFGELSNKLRLVPRPTSVPPRLPKVPVDLNDLFLPKETKEVADGIITKETATIAGGVLGAIVLGRFALSGRDEVVSEAAEASANKRRTKSIRSTMAIKNVNNDNNKRGEEKTKPPKVKASTRIAAEAQALAAAKQALQQLDTGIPSSSAQPPKPEPAAVQQSSGSTAAAAATTATTTTKATTPPPAQQTPGVLPSIASTTAAGAPAAASPQQTGGGSYLDTLAATGDGSKPAAAVKSSYSPFGSGGKPKAPPPPFGNYHFTPSSDAQAAYAPPSAATSATSYIDELKNSEATTPMTATSYAPFGANARETPPVEPKSNRATQPPPEQSDGVTQKAQSNGTSQPPQQSNYGAAQPSQETYSTTQSPLPPPKGKKSYLPYGQKPKGKPWWNNPT